MVAERFFRAVFAGLAALALGATGVAAEKFEPGQPIVVDVNGRYHRGTVEKTAPEGGCTRVDYRWIARDMYGSGYTYPGCTRAQKIYTLEQAKKQNLTISDDASAAPETPAARPPSSSTAPAPGRPSQAAGTSRAGTPEASRDSQASPAQQRQLLQEHNRWREKVGVPPLEWSDAVAGTAQAWADHLAAIGRLQHDPDTKYGENLFIGSGNRAPADAVDGWGSEKAMCGYQDQPVSRAQRCPVGHYTQMVWRDSRKLGCGITHTSRGRSRTVWVCRYDPPGNFIGQKPY